LADVSERKDPHEMVCDIMTNIADCVMENMGLLVDCIPEMFYKNSAGAKGRTKAVAKDGEPKKKRALTGYLLFGPEVRINIKEEGSKIAPKEVMTEIAKRWKLLTPSQKESFQQRAGSPTDPTDEQPLALPVPVAVEAPAAKKQKKNAEAPAIASAVVAPAAEESEEDKAKREKKEKKQRKKEKREKKQREEAEAAAAAAK